MQWRNLTDSVYVLTLDGGEEVIQTLSDFAASQSIQSATISAVGAMSNGTLAWWGPSETYSQKFFTQSEVVSFTGNIAAGGDPSPSGAPAPLVHAHVMLAGNYSAFGGHLLVGYVSPLFEVVVTTYPTKLWRKYDDATRVWVLDLSRE